MRKKILKPGIPPSVQLKEANEALGKGKSKYQYLPHFGAKQLAKAKKRADKMKDKK